MPTPVKALHCASSIDELQEKAKLHGSVQDTNTAKLFKSAERILKEADRNFKVKDEELAYIYYLKFVDLVITLRQRPDFKKHPASNILSHSANESLGRASNLKKSLLTRYAAIKAAEEEKNDSYGCSPILRPRNTLNSFEHEVPVDSSTCSDLVIDTAVEHSISASRLLLLVKDPRSCHTLLIIDTRSADNFEDSHIKHTSCINIPFELIIPGTTAKNLENALPEASVLKWHERFKVDYVVLIDWDTTDDTCLPPGHPLYNLKEAMCKWDLKPLKKPPLILSGGYKEWILRYPMYSTKALDILSLDTQEKIPFITDVSEICFPDFDEADEREKDESTLVIDKNKKNAIFNENKFWSDHFSTPPVNRQNKPRQQMNNIFSKITEFDTPFKFTDKPNSKNVDISSAKLFQPANSESKENAKVPQVHRCLKPAASSVSNRDFSNQKDAKFKFTRSVSEEEEKENEFSYLRLLKELEAEECMRIELQKKEEKLMEVVNIKDRENKEVQSKYIVLEEENRKMKKKLLERTNTEQKRKEQDSKEFERLEQQFCQQKKKVYDKGSNDGFDKHNLSAHTLFYNEKDEQEKGEDMNKEYTVSLKKDESDVDSDNSNRSLTRSFSSPNIAQLVSEPILDHKAKLPQVDRSLKPKIDHMFPHVNDTANQLRTRNLNPIYGHCPARPVTGLRNLGNTCFMNSIIQCLSNTEQIANYFTTGQYRYHVRRNKQGSNGEVAEEFAVVIRALHASTFKSIYPKDLKNILSKYIPMCAGSNQQDSHEFFLSLYEQLHADLNQGHDVEPLPDLDTLPEKVATEKFWNHHLSQNRSKLSQTFEGLLKSTLLCLSCRKTSNSYEVFSCLSLPIPSSKCTLKDCFSSFLRSEKMSGEGAWHCPICKQKKEAEKVLSICKFPNVLIIQLKRFCYDGMWKKKLQCSVEFQPLLDIQPGEIYELYAIVQHFGCLEGGHYTASCKNAATGKWYKYDDHDVSEINFNEIQTYSAYLLFYTARERKHC